MGSERMGRMIKKINGKANWYRKTKNPEHIKQIETRSGESKGKAAKDLLCVATTFEEENRAEDSKVKAAEDLLCAANKSKKYTLRQYMETKTEMKE